MTKEELSRWKEVYDRQAERVYRTAFLYLRNVQDAEDALQGVFLKQMEKAVFFSDEKQEKAWFLTVTKNYCKDMKKAFWKRKVSLLEFPEDFPGRGAEEGGTELRNLVLSLPLRYREVLHLYYFEGYSIREMADILKRNPSTIGSRLAAARKRLKQKMEQEGFVYG